MNWTPWRRKSTDTWSTLREFLASASSKTGIAVNWKTALQASTALACARVIAEGLAQVPLKVHQSRPGGGSDVVYDHPLYDVLHNSPNDWQTSYEWREMTGLHLVFAGNSYAYINRIRDDVVELLPFEPGSVVAKRSDGRTTYVVQLEGAQQQSIQAEDMLHLRGPSWNGWQGLDGVHLAREAIGLSLAAEEHATRFFSNGARVGGVLSTDGNLTPDQLKTLKDSWNETQGGLANAYKTAVLFGGMKFSPMGMQNDHAQMIELRNQQVEEICRGKRVLPIMVGYSDKTATYASAEQMFLAHVVHTMGPWYANLEQKFDQTLLSKADRKKGLYTKFSVAGLLRGAHKDRADYYTKALGAGGSPAWMTSDEVRNLEELNPMGGAAALLPAATNVPKIPDSDTGDTPDEE